MITVNQAKTNEEKESCFSIRAEVFVVEQGVPKEIEWDEYDISAFHFLARSQRKPVGTARVILKDNGATAKIGRVAVCRAERGSGVGRHLIAAIESSPELADVACFMLEAQTRAVGFYEGLGYEAYGDEFMEAGIPHRRMKKANTARTA